MVPMRIALLYIDAGQGHFLPARAIGDALESMGHQVIIDNYFTIHGADSWSWFSKNLWRFELRFPRFERAVNPLFDTPKFVLSKADRVIRNYHNKTKTWYEATLPDCVVCTHFLGMISMKRLLASAGVDIPVFAYNPDTFFTVRSAIVRAVDRSYVATEEGRADMIACGDDPTKVKVIAFPLRKSFFKTDVADKASARKALGFDQRFTIMVNLGGEGIGASSVIFNIITGYENIQLIILGTISKNARNIIKQYNTLKKRTNTIISPGFVQDVYTYLLASDLVIGKPGPNAMVEAFFAQRPFMITYKMNRTEHLIEYLEKHEVGWFAPTKAEQSSIISRCIDDPAYLRRYSGNCSTLPLRYGADEIASDIVAFTRNYPIETENPL